MSEWKSFSLGDVVKFRNGKKRPLATGDVPVYGGNGILSYTNQFNFSNCVVIGRVGAYCGNVFLAKEYCWVSDNAIATLPKESVNVHFLFYLLKSLRLNTYSIGSGQPLLTQGILNELKINLPSLETQKKIAAVLSALDDKIELNNAINRNLEEQARAIYKNMFVDNFNPAWRKCRADEVFNISIGKTPPRKEHQWFTQDAKDITWVSISDMGSCGVYIGRSSEYLTAEAVKKFNVKKVPRNTVILSFKLTVGRVAITNRELTTNEAIAHFITNDSSMTEYVYLYLKNFSYQTMGSTSSIATAINSKIIKAMSFVLPTEEELCTFHKLVEPLFLMILQNQHENQKLGELRDALLPRLMSGEIDVSSIEI